MSWPRRGTVTTAGKSSVRRRVVPPSYLAGTATPARRAWPGRAGPGRAGPGRASINQRHAKTTDAALHKSAACIAARPELIIILTPPACHPPRHLGVTSWPSSRRRQIQRGAGRTLKILIWTIKENYTDPTHPQNADEARLRAWALPCVLSVRYRPTTFIGIMFHWFRNHKRKIILLLLLLLRRLLLLLLYPYDYDYHQ